MQKGKDTYYPKYFISFIVTTLLTFALMTALTQLWGAPVKEAMIRIIAITLSALFFFIVYFMRFAVLIVGTLAALKIKKSISLRR